MWIDGEEKTMTWREFKALIEDGGTQDDMPVGYRERELTFPNGMRTHSQSFNFVRLLPQPELED